MGSTNGVSEADAAALFSQAAANLASEAILLMQRLDEEAPPTRSASRALALAAEAAEEIDRLARQGASLREAYLAAASALLAASVALSESKARARPWVHHIPGRPPAGT